jgi:general secretion pathway protein B
MSFILDALKKSETDRQRQNQPAMFEVKVAPPKARFPLWAIGLGLLLGINLLVLVGMLMRQGTAERAATQAAATVATVEPAAGGSPPAQAPAVMAPTVSTTTLAPGQQQVATVTVTVPTGSVAPNVVVAPTPGQATDPGLTAGVIAPSGAPPLVEEPVLSGDGEPIAPDYNPADYAPAVSAATQPSRTRPASSGGGLPTRDDVVTSGGPQIPAMRLDLHVYAQNAAERFVFLNMRKLREGESLPDGTRVESITPTGAVVSYRGTRFTLQSE